MQKLNRKLEYSLIALKHMSRKAAGELTTAKEVSESYHSPFDATARVMQMMASRGLLRSEQGAYGGYKISKDLTEITLLDLMEVVEGPTQIAKCLQDNSGRTAPCEIQGHCNIISPVHQLNHKLNAFYRSIQLRELLGESENHAGPSQGPYTKAQVEL